MASSKDYIAKIKEMSREDLKHLWKTRNDDDIKTFWEPGKVLEYTLLRAFELEGAKIRWPYSVKIGDDDNSEMEQIDGSIQFEYFHVLVECKDYESGKKVNIEPFAKMRNQLMRRPSAVIGCIFSTSGFSEPALVLSHYSAPQTILLWGGDEFEYCLKRGCFIKGLKEKYCKAIEEFVFYYNIVPINLFEK